MEPNFFENINTRYVAGIDPVIQDFDFATLYPYVTTNSMNVRDGGFTTLFDETTYYKKTVSPILTKLIRRNYGISDREIHLM